MTLILDNRFSFQEKSLPSPLVILPEVVAAPLHPPPAPRARMCCMGDRCNNWRCRCICIRCRACESCKGCPSSDLGIESMLGLANGCASEYTHVCTSILSRFILTTVEFRHTRTINQFGLICLPIRVFPRKVVLHDSMSVYCSCIILFYP